MLQMDIMNVCVKEKLNFEKETEAYFFTKNHIL